MPTFTGSTIDIISDICFIMSIVFAILVLSQVVLLFILRAKIKKKAADRNSQKLMSFAGFSLLAMSLPVLWIVICPILIIAYVVLLCYNISLIIGLIAPRKKAAPAPKKEAEPEKAPVTFEAEPEMSQEEVSQHPDSLQIKLEALKVARQLHQEVLKRGDCVSLKMLHINGRDLIELGITQGKQIGYVLNELLLKVLEHPEYNQKETLLTLAKQMVSQ